MSLRPPEKEQQGVPRQAHRRFVRAPAVLLTQPQGRPAHFTRQEAPPHAQSHDTAMCRRSGHGRSNTVTGI